VTIGSEVFELGMKLDLLQAALNGVYVPNRTLLDGRPAISVTVPTGYVDMEANVSVGGLPRRARSMASGWAMSSRAPS
jgi:hypothetical protein